MKYSKQDSMAYGDGHGETVILDGLETEKVEI